MREYQSSKEIPERKYPRATAQRARSYLFRMIPYLLLIQNQVNTSIQLSSLPFCTFAYIHRYLEDRRVALQYRQDMNEGFQIT